MSTRNAQAILGIGIPVALGLLAVIPWLLWSGDRPNPIATHFALGSGTPDGSMSPLWFGLTSGVLLAASMALVIVVATQSRSMPAASAVAWVGAFVGGLTAAAVSWTVWSQRGLADWTQASSGWSMAIYVLVVSIAAASVAVWAASCLDSPPVAAIGSEHAPKLDLAEGEAVAWSGGLVSRWFLFAAAASLAIAVVLALFVSPREALAPACIGLLVLSLGSIRVHAGPTGLTVHYGLLPWPRTRIRSTDIASASVIDAKPRDWGGWGYRGSLFLMKQAAVVLRKGPAIRVDLKNGKVFVVTVDDPTQGVAVLNAYARSEESYAH